MHHRHHHNLPLDFLRVAGAVSAVQATNNYQKNGRTERIRNLAQVRELTSDPALRAQLDSLIREEMRLLNQQLKADQKTRELLQALPKFVGGISLFLVLAIAGVCLVANWQENRPQTHQLTQEEREAKQRVDDEQYFNLTGKHLPDFHEQ
jgi:hypothetical protein